MTFREDNKKAAIEYFSSRPTPFGGDGSWSPLATSWRMVMLSLLGAVFTLRTGLCEEAGDDCHHQTIIIVSHQTCKQRDFHNSWRRHQSSTGGFNSAERFQQGEGPVGALSIVQALWNLAKSRWQLYQSPEFSSSRAAAHWLCHNCTELRALTSSTQAQHQATSGTSQRTRAANDPSVLTIM